MVTRLRNHLATISNRRHRTLVVVPNHLRTVASRHRRMPRVYPPRINRTHYVAGTAPLGAVRVGVEAAAGVAAQDSGTGPATPIAEVYQPPTVHAAAISTSAAVHAHLAHFLSCGRFMGEATRDAVGSCADGKPESGATGIPAQAGRLCHPHLAAGGALPGDVA